MKVKVITLFSGESEYQECKISVKRQTVSFQVDHFFIEGKSKPEAHNILYSTIMSESSEYDYFVKLDADMIFTSDNALEKIINYAIASNSGIFSIPVHDYMTDSMIWGLNVYKSGVKWFVETDNLFTDQQRIDGCYKKEKKKLDKCESLVSHASMATDFQGYIFGVHRAAKIIQYESVDFRFGHSFGQLQTLKLVLERYKKNNSKVAASALVGAYQLIVGELGRYDMIKREDYRACFENVKVDEKLKDALFFFSPNSWVILIRIFGFYGISCKILKHLIRKL
ncbi:MAG: hypothetical protein IBX55_21850 [Methyloprofundus sp.]|nr:hypothetical protein [Methyloprofundus sp.]